MINFLIMERKISQNKPAYKKILYMKIYLMAEAVILIHGIFHFINRKKLNDRRI